MVKIEQNESDYEQSEVQIKQGMFDAYKDVTKGFDDLIIHYANIDIDVDHDLIVAVNKFVRKCFNDDSVDFFNQIRADQLCYDRVAVLKGFIKKISFSIASLNMINNKLSSTNYEERYAMLQYIYISGMQAGNKYRNFHLIDKQSFEHLNFCFNKARDLVLSCPSLRKKNDNPQSCKDENSIFGLIAGDLNISATDASKKIYPKNENGQYEAKMASNGKILETRGMNKEGFSPIESFFWLSLEFVLQHISFGDEQIVLLSENHSIKTEDVQKLFLKILQDDDLKNDFLNILKKAMPVDGLLVSLSKGFGFGALLGALLSAITLFFCPPVFVVALIVDSVSLGTAGAIINAADNAFAEKKQEIIRSERTEKINRISSFAQIENLCCSVTNFFQQTEQNRNLDDLIVSNAVI